MIRQLLVLVLVLSSSIPALGQDGDSPVSAKLVCSHDMAKPGGLIRIGAQLVVKEGWMVSWKNPGNVGEPLVIKPQSSDALSVRYARWPAPLIDFVKGTGQVYGYAGSPMVVCAVKIAKDAKPGKHTFTVQAQWTAHKDGKAQKGEGAISIDVVVGDKVVLDKKANKLIQRWFRKAPVAEESGAKVDFVKGDERSHYKVVIPAVEGRTITMAQFVPFKYPRRLRGAVKRSKNGEGSLELMVPIMGKNEPEKIPFRGVLTLRGTMKAKGSDKATRFEKSFAIPAKKK